MLYLFIWKIIDVAPTPTPQYDTAPTPSGETPGMLIIKIL
jgi:hypothetical protein